MTPFIRIVQNRQIHREIKQISSCQWLAQCCQCHLSLSSWTLITELQEDTEVSSAIFSRKQRLRKHFCTGCWCDKPETGMWWQPVWDCIVEQGNTADSYHSVLWECRSHPYPCHIMIPVKCNSKFSAWGRSKDPLPASSHCPLVKIDALHVTTLTIQLMYTQFSQAPHVEAQKKLLLRKQETQASLRLGGVQ